MDGGSEPDLIDSFGEFVSAWDFSSPPAIIFLLLAGVYVIGSIRLAMRSDTDSDYWSKVAASLFGFVLLAISLAGPPAALGPGFPHVGEVGIAVSGEVPAPVYQNQMAATVAELLGLDYTNRLPIGGSLLD